MITEDYVSFETAKLLKKKGFDERCECFYDTENYNKGVVNEWMDISNSELEEKEFICYSAPTIQMVMKWLREKYNWHIEICRGPKGYHIWIVTIPLGVTKYITEEVCGKGIKYLDTYEEACEAGIRYCLKNLI